MDWCLMTKKKRDTYLYQPRTKRNIVLACGNMVTTVDELDFWLFWEETKWRQLSNDLRSQGKKQPGLWLAADSHLFFLHVVFTSWPILNALVTHTELNQRRCCIVYHHQNNMFSCCSCDSPQQETLNCRCKLMSSACFCHSECFFSLGLVILSIFLPQGLFHQHFKLWSVAAESASFARKYF